MAGNSTVKRPGSSQSEKRTTMSPTTKRPSTGNLLLRTTPPLIPPPLARNIEAARLRFSQQVESKNNLQQFHTSESGKHLLTKQASFDQFILVKEERDNGADK